MTKAHFPPCFIKAIVDLVEVHHELLVLASSALIDRWDAYKALKQTETTIIMLDALLEQYGTEKRE